MLTLGAKDSVELPDGRQLAWSQWGPEDGHPVIFCTGAGMSGSLGFGIDHLSELGLRLLAVDRPGLGHSTPHPTKTLTTWTDDVRCLVEHRGLGQIAAVGFSQPNPRRRRSASRIPERTQTSP